MKGGSGIQCFGPHLLSYITKWSMPSNDVCGHDYQKRSTGTFNNQEANTKELGGCRNVQIPK
jgi:hypothetical protein